MTSWQYFENEVLFSTQADLCPLFSPLGMDTFGKTAPTQEICCFLPFHSLYISSTVHMNWWQVKKVVWFNFKAHSTLLKPNGPAQKLIFLPGSKKGLHFQNSAMMSYVDQSFSNHFYNKFPAWETNFYFRDISLKLIFQKLRYAYNNTL